MPAETALNFIQEHCSALSPIDSSLTGRVSWCPPPDGIIKVNCDAVVSGGLAAFGCVARDSSGSVFGMLWRVFDGVFGVAG
ncbi:hypothetical protein LguiB_019303 [Lonicera macranthoides]